ncbi:MAG: hypothetical protein IJ794_16495 [Lachnospiraceae bacterium]|nr:hypothetical protein [Lachnospiraceae bacterium]
MGLLNDAKEFAQTMKEFNAVKCPHLSIELLKPPQECNLEWREYRFFNYLFGYPHCKACKKMIVETIYFENI